MKTDTEILSDLAGLALKAWDLTVRDIRLLKVRENAVFRVLSQNGSEYALRLHRAGYRTDQELRSELAWIRALLEDGFDVPEVVTTTAGDLFTVVSDEGFREPRQVDLFHWISGRPLGVVEAALEGDQETLARSFHTIGKLAARLHNQSSRWRPPEGFTRPSWDSEGLVGDQPLWGRFWGLSILTDEQRALIRRARSAVRQELSGLERTGRNYGLIHADFSPENLLVDGSRVRVIDFDDAGYGWHLFDIATSLYFQLGKPYFETIERAMLAGYRGERDLTATDQALLPLFYAARGFTYLGWIQTRQETEEAREHAPLLVGLCCEACTQYLGTRL